MNNKVALALLSEMSTTLKSISILILLFNCVFLIFLQQNSNFLAVSVLGALLIFIEMNANTFKRLLSSFLRTYNIYTLIQHQNNIHLINSSVKRRSV